MTETRVEQHLRATEAERPDAGRRRAPALVVLGALAVLLLVAVGLGSGRPVWDIGGPPGLVDPGAYSGDLVVLGFTLLAVLPWIMRLIQNRRRRAYARPDPDVPRVRLPWWGKLVVGLLITTAVVLSLLLLSLLPGSHRQDRKHGRPPGQGLAKPPPTRVDNGLSPVHWWGLGGLALVVLGGVATVWYLRERRPPVPEAEPEDELLAAVDESLEDLETETDPRRAVIRAYARMERALEAQGLGRRPSETPLEFLGRALTALKVGRPSVERLSALYERAKFSSHEIDWSMRTDALRALTTLRAELAGVAA